MRAHRLICILALALLSAIAFPTVVRSDRLRAVPSQQADGITQEGGQITGRVTSSLDGAAVPGIYVTASRDGGDWATTEVTDSSGGYQIIAPAGSYRLLFHQLGTVRYYLDEYYNHKPDAQSADLVTVIAGQVTGPIDFVMTFGGQITGRVTANSGQPLPGIPVDAYDALGQVAGRGETDASGAYTVTALPTGNYRLHFDADRWEASSQDCAGEYYDDKPTLAAADPVGAAVNHVTGGIDAALTCGGRITGRVTSAQDGAPIPDVYVEANGAYRARTDALGVYTIIGLPAGVYTVHFNPPLLGVLNPFMSEYYNDRSDWLSADPIAVPLDSAVTGIDAALTLGGQIAGRVTASENGAPIAEVSVYAVDPEGNLMGQGLTGADGRYTIERLTTGSYRVRFYSDPYLSAYYGVDAYQSEYYDDRLTFKDADPIPVALSEVTGGIDAALTRRGREALVATSTALPGVIVVSPEGARDPIYSLNGGATWRSFATVPWKVVGTQPQVAVVPRDDPLAPVRFLVAVSSDIHNWPAHSDKIGVYRTGDYGLTWARYLPPYGLCNTVDQYFPQLVASPAGPGRLYLRQYCFYNSPRGGTIYATNYTSLGGIGWTPMHLDATTLEPSPVLPQRVYEGYGRWYVSDDSGETASPVDFPVHFLQQDWGDAALLYGVSLDRAEVPVPLYTGKRSTDGGVTWSAWREQPCPTSFEQLLAIPTPARYLLMRCAQGLYRSVDGGESWEKLSADRGRSLSVDSGVRGRVFWTRDNDLWASTDAGSTWILLTESSLPERLYVPAVRN